MSSTAQACALPEDERSDVSHIVTEDDSSVDNSLVLWEGIFEEVHGVWLRWADLEGNVIPTGAERAHAAAKRADDAQARAHRLAEKLRALGIDPNGDG